MLGMCTAHGVGTRRDPEKGIKMVERAAVGGNIAAMRAMSDVSLHLKSLP